MLLFRTSGLGFILGVGLRLWGIEALGFLRV